MVRTLLIPLLLSLSLLPGCSADRPSAPPAASPAVSPAISPVPTPEGAEVLPARIVDGAETGALVLAGEGAGEVYLLDASGLPVELDGAPAAPERLRDGMEVEVVYDGMILETYPARFSSPMLLRAHSPAEGERVDLCGLYLQVLEDLYRVDGGLNKGLTELGVDLSGAPGDLTEGERSAVAYCFGMAHGLLPVTGTWEELAEAGYLTGETLADGTAVYTWQTGCHFSIRAHEGGQGEDGLLRFDAVKRRGPLGAYCFYDCTAAPTGGGVWETYSMGEEMIS